MTVLTLEHAKGQGKQDACDQRQDQSGFLVCSCCSAQKRSRKSKALMSVFTCIVKILISVRGFVQITGTCSVTCKFMSCTQRNVRATFGHDIFYGIFIALHACGSANPSGAIGQNRNAHARILQSAGEGLCTLQYAISPMLAWLTGCDARYLLAIAAIGR